MTPTLPCSQPLQRASCQPFRCLRAPNHGGALGISSTPMSDQIWVTVRHSFSPGSELVLSCQSHMNCLTDITSPFIVLSVCACSRSQQQEGGFESGMQCEGEWGKQSLRATKGQSAAEKTLQQGGRGRHELEFLPDHHS
jgi:hypothetical protein